MTIEDDIIANGGVSIIYAEDIYEIRSNTIPNNCGAYIITTNSGKRYIGSSVNVCNRIATHNIRDKESISIYLTENIDDAKILERWLIQKLNPELNIRRPKKVCKMRTLALEEDVHALIVKEQEILKKHGVYMTLSDITSYILENYSRNMEDILKDMFKKGYLNI